MNKDIEVSFLYENIKDLDMFIDHTPVICKKDYTDKINSTIELYKNKYDDPSEILNDQGYIDEIRYYQEYILTYIDERVLNIDDKLTNFNDILLKLKK